ncbi:MAG: hypothetical protein PVF13_03455 [Chromatiales bacterium]
MNQQLNKLGWASARLFFILYIGFCVVSLVGGFVTAPLMTWYFYGDWRFWRFLSSAPGLFTHALRLLRLMTRDNRSFMFTVPLSTPPRTSPDPASALLQRFWPHGESCGDCSNCCRPGGHACPLLDEASGLCLGYNSFYWRYFNCGRFPSTSEEIEYYDCRKWVVGPAQPIIFPTGELSRCRQERVSRDLCYYEDGKARGASTAAKPDDEPIPSEPLINPATRKRRLAWRDAADS